LRTLAGFYDQGRARFASSPVGVTVAFVSDARCVNSIAFGGISVDTDVLSFPAEQDEFEKVAGSTLGDVVISVEQAARQAKDNDLTFDQEIAQLILHGLLHLCGYDHSTDNGEMNGWSSD